MPSKKKYTVAEKKSFKAGVLKCLRSSRNSRKNKTRTYTGKKKYRSK